MCDEPGSQNSGIPMAKQALAQKRNVRDLNTRLEMFVRAQAEKTRQVNQYKEAIARQELEYKNKISQHKLQYQDTLARIRKENEDLVYDNKCKQEECNTAFNTKKDFEDRLLSSEERNATLTSENTNIRNDLNRQKEELNKIRKDYASVRYKFESYEAERKSFDERMAKQKVKNEHLLRDLTQKEASLKAEKQTFDRVIIEKNDEIDSYRTQIQNLECVNNTTQTRLRKEFDNKLAEFVQKREEQYKQEKDEWMRIFKEEFNRKLRSFKEANQELAHSNLKQSEEITDLRARISKLKQQKTELEVTNRSNEEEIEKVRNDLDDLRRTKDNEIKVKNQLIIQERDRFKAKELQFDELAGIKLQLDSEIELYRNILNEAEQECGYSSPMLMKNSCNTNTRGSRKRKRMNPSYHMTPMAPIASHGDSLSFDVDTSDNKQVVTPGIARAAKIAQNDLKAFVGDEDHEMKDHEESECFESGTTPTGIEGGALQFSGLDLNKGMIEIRNMGEEAVKLEGYALSNSSGTMIYELPKSMTLASRKTLRIYVGEELYKEFEVNQEEDDEFANKKFLGDYSGAYVFWGNDVWTGTDRDCARLYNASQTEVARIEISPDMIDAGNEKKNCTIM